MTEVGLAPLTGRELDAVVAIDERCYAQPWSPKVWSGELAEPSRYHVVARIDGEVVGHAGLLLTAGEAHVITVAVHPDRQGNGVATALLLDLLGHARGVGAEAAALEVRASACRARRLYGRLGFVPSGIHRSYYGDPAEDALVMTLPDLQSAEIRTRLARVAQSLRRGSRP